MARTPSRGHPVHEFIESGLREVHEGTYRIIYDIHDEVFQVVTIVHMKQRITRRRLR
jgi:mRNA-degrading endonuclease RelE of RelBE toxin-antitoxin system